MKKGLLFIVFVTLTAFVWNYFDIGMYASLDALKDNKMLIIDYVDGNYILAVGMFIGLYIASTVFSLPIATFLTLLGGFLFGALFGTLYVVVGATIGATVLYVLARSIFHDWLYARFGERFKHHLHKIESDAFNYILFLRLVPIFPFFVVNIAPAFAKIRTRDYVLATLFGIIPGSFVYVYAGRALDSIESVSDILSPTVIGAFVLLGSISLAPVVYKKARAKGSRTHADSTNNFESQ